MDNKKEFEEFLTNHGAVLVEPTNEWEVIRFVANGATSIIYRKKTGLLTFTGESQRAYLAWLNNRPWRAVTRKRQNLRDKKAKLAARDGKKCFYHGENLPFDKLTIEHLLNISQGGTDNENNLCLACENCNKAVGNWPLTKKMLWRDQMLNKAEGVAVKEALLMVWQLYQERFKSLSKFKLLSPHAPKVELRKIIEAMTGERI